jgi:hypothetical protein
LYAFHLLKIGNRDGAVRTLAAGLRFSHDVANGGSLFATLIAKDLLVSHLRTISDAVRLEKLSSVQRSRLETAVTQLGRGLDWPTAAKRDLETLRGDYAATPQASAALTRIISSFVAVVNDQSKFPELDQAIEGAPRELSELIPNARRVSEQRQDLSSTILQTRSILQ